jgi:hypothetical protein
VFAKGQCQFRKFENSNFCIAHGGNSAANAAAKNSVKQYHLTKWQNRLEHFADNSKVKSLRDEIGLLRILVEERMNQCHDTNDLLMHSTVIADLVSRIQTTVVACQKLESQLGGLIDKQQVLQIAQEIVALIDNKIENKEIVNVIQIGILGIIERISMTPKDE